MTSFHLSRLRGRSASEARREGESKKGGASFAPSPTLPRKREREKKKAWLFEIVSTQQIPPYPRRREAPCRRMGSGLHGSRRVALTCAAPHHEERHQSP